MAVNDRRFAALRQIKNAAFVGGQLLITVAHWTGAGGTSRSWLNLVERWFAEITRERIRRGSFCSVSALVTAIKPYLREHNENPRPFIWTATASSILRKIEHCIEAIGAGS